MRRRRTWVVTWAISKVDDNYTESQGTAVVTHPMTGQVSVFWRSFNSPHTMVMRRSTSNGWAKPVDLLANDPLKTLATFDQPCRLYHGRADCGDSIRNELAFRSNAFPVAAFTPDGSALIVAWHEKVNGQGLPDPNGSPRIVWKYSRDGGTTGRSASARGRSPGVARRAGILQPVGMHRSRKSCRASPAAQAHRTAAL